MNTIHTFRRASRTRCIGAVAGAVMGLVATSVLAQGVYRIVGPDGRVSYSDQPPPTGAVVRPAGNFATSSPGSAQLPFELRQVSSRYPVTLYTSKDCAPCNSGRNLLNARGVPYLEKTVNTSQDADALKRLSGEVSLPFLTIGGQQIKGYADSEWTQFLDAAGYPKQSALPSSYRQPASTPLVAVKPVESTPPKSTVTQRAAKPVEVPVAPPVENPAGIRF